MKSIQLQLIELSKTRDLSKLGLREAARILGVKHPQTVKYHLAKLKEAGLISDFSERSSHVEKSKLGNSDLVTIPVLGAANAGPATHIAEGTVEGYIKVSSALLVSRSYASLYALRVTGSSMNQAKIAGEPVRDGDYAIIDSEYRSPQDGDYVIAVVDNLANLKKFHVDKKHNQIVLLSESTEDYMPIFIHPDDESEGLISGRVVQIIRKPVLE
jgi:SOS-response transcriptional repressor LexA